MPIQVNHPLQAPAAIPIMLTNPFDTLLVGENGEGRASHARPLNTVTHSRKSGKASMFFALILLEYKILRYARSHRTE